MENAGVNGMWQLGFQKTFSPKQKISEKNYQNEIKWNGAQSQAIYFAMIRKSKQRFQ